MLAAAAAAQVPGSQAFVMLAPLGKAQRDRQEDRSRIEQLLEQRPEVASRLERGDHVALPPAEAELLPQATTASGYSSLVLLPVLYQSSVEALLCVALPDQGGELGGTQMEALRQLCRHAAPAVARLRELETLRHEVNVLRKRAERTAELESALAAASHTIEAVEASSFFKTRRIERFVHDLSSPLQIIDIYSKTLANQPDAAAREQAATIREKTQRIIRVMKQFRVLEDVSLNVESFDLRELWKEAVQHVRGSIQEKAIKVTEHIPAQDFTVYGDRAKLGRVFTDLAVNAAKFAEAGGEITVEFENRGDRVVVKLSDTGVAIPPEVLEKVTDRYAQPDAQGESPRTTGFPLIDDYVRLHGGKISVASKVGQGSTFVLELPLIQPHDLQGERKAS
jgi:signal transduction histidine kinase